MTVPGIPSEVAPALATAERVLDRSAVKAPGLPSVTPDDALAAAPDLENAEALSRAQRVEHAWRRYRSMAADVPQTQDLLLTSIKTITLNPRRFGNAFWDEFTAVLAEQWDETLQFDRQLREWIGSFLGCQAQLTIRWYFGTAQDFTGPCAFIGEAIDTVRQIGRALETVDELTGALNEAVIEDPGVVLEFAATFLEVEALLIEALSDDRGAYAWLRPHAEDPQQLGEILAAIYAIAYFEIVTDLAGAGVERLAKVSKLLTVVDGVPPAVPVLPATGGMRAAARTRRSSALRSGRYSPQLEQLIAKFREALHKGGKKLTGRITNQRLRLLLRNLTINAADYARWLRLAGKHVGHAFRALHYTTGAYSTLNKTLGRFNAGANVLPWLELLSQKPTIKAIDEATAIAETGAQATRLLEAAHGLDRRFLEIPHFAALVREHLGWANADAATAMALTPAEHTRSLMALLRKYGGVTEADVPGANAPSVKRLTTLFNDKIKWVDDPTGTPPKGVIWLSRKSTLTDLINAHKDVWEKHYPGIWRHWAPHFAEWLNAAQGH